INNVSRARRPRDGRAASTKAAAPPTSNAIVVAARANTRELRIATDGATNSADPGLDRLRYAVRLGPLLPPANDRATNAPRGAPRSAASSARVAASTCTASIAVASRDL